MYEIGIGGGGVLLIVVILFLIWWCVKSRDNLEDQSTLPYNQFVDVESGLDDGTQTLDLHGLSVKEARTQTFQFLEENRGSRMKIITGRGLHSLNGVPILKPVIQKLLIKEGYYFEEADRGGSVVIDAQTSWQMANEDSSCHL